MSIASRVNRLQRHVSEAPCAVCGGTPRVHRMSFVYEGEPAPSFPGPNAPDHCACGRRVEYFHIRHHLEGIGDRPRDSRPDVIDGPATLVERLVGIDAMKAARTYKRWATVPVGASAEAEA
jgi:hypothetical protein